MRKILLIDDAEFMRGLFKNYLTNIEDIDIIEANCGTDGIMMYRSEGPDLVLLDITMGDISGIEVLRDIKAFNPSAKVIICSAMGQESFIAEAVELGAIDFLVKPVKSDLLINAVNKALNG